MDDWNRLGRHVVSGESIGSIKKWLDDSMDRDDRWDGEILDYSKGGRQGAASCRSLTGLLQSHHFLYSYITASLSRKCEKFFLYPINFPSIILI